jgi:prevent-host-death family protein
MAIMTNSDDSSLKTVAAAEAKQSFGKLLDDAQHEPVRIERNGRPVAVLLSMAEYELFEKLEDAHWGKRAQEAMKEGLASPEETEQVLRSILHAAD